MQRLLLIAALTLACSSADEPPGSGPGGPGGGGDAGGAGGAGGSGAGLPDVIVLDETNGALALDFDIAITGMGSDVIGAVDLTSATGHVEIGGESLAAVAYERQPFGQWVLYQTLVVAPDRWYVVWNYCNGDVLEWIYYEGTDATALSFEAAMGTCTEGPGPLMADVQLPAVEMPPPLLIDGFTISGPAVDIDGAAPGHVDLASQHTVFGFEHVDCTTDCGAPGWRELHAILWDAPAARAAFAIFYLFDDDPQIQLSYALSLPDLGDPVGGSTALDATWSYQP